jgi:hypothetical protein
MASSSFNLTKSGTTSSGSYILGRIVWSSKANIEDNYSSVTATLYCKKANDGMTLTQATSGTWTYSLSINGNAISGTVQKSILTDWVAIASHSVGKISHDDNGNKSITIQGSVKAPSGTSFSGKSTSGSKSVALDAIPRASTVTATTANIGSKSTITIKRASSKFTHTLTYLFGTISGTIATKTSSTSISWTIPTEFYTQIPGTKTGYGSIYCTTYIGSTQIGSTTSCNFTVTTEESLCKPDVAVTAVGTNSAIISLTGSNKRIVRGFSEVKVTTTATPKNSAVISSVSVTCGSSTKKGTSVTFNRAESATITATAKDSRGYTNSASASGLTLVNYLVPTLVSTVERENPTSDKVNITVRGNWYNGSFGVVTNTLKAEVRYKPKSQSEYTDANAYVGMTLSVSGNTYTATATLTGLPYTEAYSLQIRISDAIHKDGGIASAVYKNTEIKKGIPVFDWGENDFQFNVPVILPRSLYFDANGHGGLNVNNSDITGLNNLLFYDKSGGPGESIRFYRDGTNWDCFYIIDGTVYIVPDFPANTTPHVLFSPENKPYYEAGDIVNINAVYPGWVSGGSKEFYLTIPLCKPIIGNVTVSGSIVGRGVNGYVLNSNSPRIDLSGGDGYKVIVAKDGIGIKLNLVYDEAQTAGIVNNTPINWYGEVTLTIS